MIPSEEIKSIEEKIDGKIVYLTLSGSKLYGTDSETSDKIDNLLLQIIKEVTIE